MARYKIGKVVFQNKKSAEKFKRFNESFGVKVGKIIKIK